MEHYPIPFCVFQCKLHRSIVNILQAIIIFFLILSNSWILREVLYLNILTRFSLPFIQQQFT